MGRKTAPPAAGRRSTRGPTSSPRRWSDREVARHSAGAASPPSVHELSRDRTTRISAPSVRFSCALSGPTHRIRRIESLNAEVRDAPLKARRGIRQVLLWRRGKDTSQERWFMSPSRRHRDGVLGLCDKRLPMLRERVSRQPSGRHHVPPCTHAFLDRCGRNRPVLSAPSVFRAEAQ